MATLPAPLVAPGKADGHVAAKVLLDLTLYLVGPQESELEFLVDLYESVCPRDRLVKYTITELDLFARLDEVVLTASGRSAAAAGVPRPYLSAGEKPHPRRARIRLRLLGRPPDR